MDAVGATEFARRKGVSNTLVYRALDKGRIQYIEGTNKIDWETQSVAFDNNCNLKFKMAARTRGELSRAAMAGAVQAPAYTPKPPTPPKPAPTPKAAPAPKASKAEKKAEAVAPNPVPQVEDPVIPKVTIPRKPAYKPKKERDDLSEEDRADLEAEKRASQDRDNYNRARTAEQVLKAQILDLELKQKRKEVMPTNEVRKGVQKMAEVLMKGMQAIPDRICDEIAGMHDPSDIHALMTQEINNVLKELGDAARGIAS